METKILNLWTNHRVWFYILLPIVALPLILIFAGKLMSGVNFNKAKGELAAAQQTDNQLAKQQNIAEGQAEHAQGEAQAIEKQIQENRDSQGDVDWYKKLK
jgi:hypothetical protein